MGISCQINLFRPPDGVYHPGNVVSGVIQYTLYQKTVFNKITVSLKGFGLVHVIVKHNKSDTHYKKKETYVDVDDVLENENGIEHDVGMHVRRFDFMLPYNIPSSIQYKREHVNSKRKLKAKCNIMYYIRIKFEKPGLFNFTNRFKKHINVDSGMKAVQPRGSTIYGQQNKLFKPFSSKVHIVNIKVLMNESVTAPGKNIEYQVEVTNDTDLIVKKLKTKLKEIYTLKVDGKEFKINSDIDSTVFITKSILSGENERFNFNITVPLHLRSLGSSNIMSRDYIVKVKAELPFPRRDVVVEIPVEIGEVIQGGEANHELRKNGGRDDAFTEGTSKIAPPPYDKLGEGMSKYDPPPSYWEVMGEDSDQE